MQRAHRQADYFVRFDWGLDGAAAVATDVDVAVVVDVLSFTTTLSVALDVGTAVLPYRWRDDTAGEYAREQGAVLAVGRSQTGPEQMTLSPASLRAGRPPERLVLPSPNGSTIAHQLAAGDAVCVAACLRNAAAVAGWIDARYAADAGTVAVIAAGERWPTGTLRPAAEDLWGAGAVVAHLVAAGWAGCSPEAELAAAGYAAVAGREWAALRACASGRELVDRGFSGDVEIAAEVGASTLVPVLRGDRFTTA